MQQPLCITLGDPNGLGPELVCRLLDPDAGAAAPGIDNVSWVLVGPASSLESHLGNRKPFWAPIGSLDHIDTLDPGVYLFEPEPLRGFSPEPGVASPEGGRAAGVSLAAACDPLLSGKAGAVVTLPLNKAMLQAAGFDFPGHTEFLAQAAGLKPDEVTMHLCGDKLRVSLVTTHPRLADVPRLVTFERVLRCLTHTDGFLRALGLEEGSRDIAVCGLNPHAGESGAIGTEEIEIIAPAIAEAQARGIDAFGPYPADTVFHRALHGEFAAVVAMYHDQGLGPLKLMHFHEAVNVTLGLPFVRTSVDHGTGYDLVGKHTASTGSLEAAISLASTLISQRNTPCTSE
ncbi:4-hydroxythreonine-4-phosphate dehydrogenase PdxA [Oceanidesulfovibrio marinus]|uniref:4-hydroxythreonine-4-phosphate dehydrogenase PdxA n=1 Tax=Oceanidesulfovibrio marinus TaxID=370038 RepID=A0A6P1ZMP3_9BACT|nr:4-hydroxythreonine-4-phosphate dehydrogenase PdxA [Oceanidesulfovibrio marinus]TVM35199.1 4-hydroxythreonine-4-phosphate dehydrogenase PdxA [Oceanidesulfovibrio marinus]